MGERRYLAWLGAPASSFKIRDRRDYFLLALDSVLGVSLNQLLYLAGLERTTATTAQMFIVAGPAITLAVAMMRGVERGTPLKWTGIVLAAIGALTLVAAVPANNRLGNLFILTNVVIYSVYLVLTRGIVRRYHPLTVITWIFAFGAILLVPIGAVSLIREFPELSVQGWLAVVWIIALPTVAAYYQIRCRRLSDGASVASQVRPQGTTQRRPRPRCGYHARLFWQVRFSSRQARARTSRTQHRLRCQARRHWRKRSLQLRRRR